MVYDDFLNVWTDAGEQVVKLWVYKMSYPWQCSHVDTIHGWKHWRTIYTSLDLIIKQIYLSVNSNVFIVWNEQHNDRHRQSLNTAQEKKKGKRNHVYFRFAPFWNLLKSFQQVKENKNYKMNQMNVCWAILSAS